jgi:hypothetical protein
MAIRERKREEWEVENYIEGEGILSNRHFPISNLFLVNEMVEFYMAKGVPEESARQVVSILSKYKHAFVDIMVPVNNTLPNYTLDGRRIEHCTRNCERSSLETRIGTFFGITFAHLFVD